MNKKTIKGPEVKPSGSAVEIAARMQMSSTGGGLHQVALRQETNLNMRATNEQEQLIQSHAARSLRRQSQKDGEKMRGEKMRKEKQTKTADRSGR